ncbi:MAG: hypothetical protein JNK90_13890 [Planctomycetaceae bacterium]|nr:hypothetical protein [Planctomycetaceae bacterium]
MKQLFHTIKLLAYRMRRYPMWIVVVVTAIPLWIAAQWMIESVPWTSSAEVDYAYFQRLNDQLWLKISKFPNARELVWGRNSDDIESDEILIDLGKQSTTRLRKHVSIETKSEPSVLQNGLLAYYVVNETRAFLIVNPQTFETTVVEVPSPNGEFVDGRFFLWQVDKKIYSIDLLNPSTPKHIEFPAIQHFVPVDQSQNVIISCDLVTFVKENLSRSSPKTVANPDFAIAENLVVNFLDNLHLNWSLHSIYSVNQDGLHWRTSWLTSNPEYYRPRTSQGLIASGAFFGNRIEIRSASTGKVIALHPLKVVTSDGEVSDYGHLGFGALQYYLPSTRLLLVDPRKPGRLLVPAHTKPSPLYHYNNDTPLYWTAKPPRNGRVVLGMELVEFRDRNSSEVVATWKSNLWPDKSFVLGAGHNNETVVVTDDWQRLMTVNMKNGRTLGTVVPLNTWLAPLLILGICCFVWFIACTIACELLRIPHFLQSTVLLMSVLALAWIRLSTIGHPDFEERISVQTVLAIAFVLCTNSAHHVWPRQMNTVAILLSTVFAVLAILVLNHKQDKNLFTPIQAAYFLAVGCSALLITGALGISINWARKINKASFYWRFSISPLLFWLTFFTITLFLLRFPFAYDTVYEIEPWEKIARFLPHPLLAITLWYILHWKLTGFMRKILICAFLIMSVTLIRTLVCLQETSSSEYMWQLREELFYACCATLPISILSCAFFLRLPRWLRHRAKRWLAIRSSSTILSSR